MMENFISFNTLADYIDTMALWFYLITIFFIFFVGKRVFEKGGLIVLLPIIVFTVLITIIFISGESEAVKDYSYDFENQIVELDETDDNTQINLYNCTVYINGTIAIDILYSYWDFCEVDINLQDLYFRHSISNFTNFYTVSKRLYGYDNSMFKNGTSNTLRLLDNSIIQNFTISTTLVTTSLDYVVIMNNVKFESNFYFYEEITIIENKDIKFNSNCDYLLLYNWSHGYSYNITSEGIFYNISYSYYTGNFDSYYNHTSILYNVTGYKDDVERISLSYQHLDKTNTFNFPVAITLTLNVYSGVGSLINNVSVSIRNNDTENGYYINCDGEGNIINVLSGNLFFHCSQTDDDLETKLFELNLAVNTTILIYLNLTDTIDFDKAIIDYENELSEARDEANRIFAYEIVLSVILVFIGIGCIMYFSTQWRLK